MKQDKKSRSILSFSYLKFHHPEIDRYFALLLLLPLLFLFSCFGSVKKFDTEKFRYVEFRQYGIHMMVPVGWDISVDNSRFYQVIVTGMGPNNRPASIEYRGLSTQIPDAASKSIYAAGWYEAQPKIYSSWKYVTRKKLPGDPKGTYIFEGKFKQNKAVLRRFGSLRYRGKRVQSIYYTSTDKNANLMRDFFNHLDSQHKFFQPNSK